MATLSVLCPICSEFFDSKKAVYSTKCGHLFHQRCLFRWLKNSQTCPQCRLSCHQHRVHKVYLNFGKDVAAVNEEPPFELKDPRWEILDLPEQAGAVIELPEGAIKAGTDEQGNDVYVARVEFKSDLLPANFAPALGGAHAAWGCLAHFLRNDIELLVGSNYKWVAASDGHVPMNAIKTGYTDSDEDLYTARTEYNGILLPGKLCASHGVLYMPYQGKEINCKQYEVLVENL